MVDDDNHGVIMSNEIVDITRHPLGGLITFGVDHDVMDILMKDSLLGSGQYSLFCIVVDRVEEKKYEDKQVEYISLVEDKIRKEYEERYKHIEETLEAIVKDCAMLTSGNVSHNAASIQGIAQRRLDDIRKHKNGNT